jgi:hypothetical protein
MLWLSRKDTRFDDRHRRLHGKQRLKPVIGTFPAASVHGNGGSAGSKRKPSAVGVRPIAGRFEGGPNVVGVTHHTFKHKPTCRRGQRHDAGPNAVRMPGVGAQARPVAPGHGRLGNKASRARQVAQKRCRCGRTRIASGWPMSARDFPDAVSGQLPDHNRGESIRPLYEWPTIRSELEWSSGWTCELCGSNAA